jgi:FkbM family methyltransferase
LKGREVSFLFDNSFIVQLRAKEGVSRLTFYFGASEPDLFAFYASFFRDGMVVIDAGANIGLHTLFITKRVAPSGKVFSFEASQKNFNRLVENWGRTTLKNVNLYPFALGDKRGKIFFRDDVGDSSRSRIVQKNSGLVVDMISLDDFCQNESIACIDLIKLDVEGAEMRFLQGGKSPFSRGGCRILQIELDQNNLSFQGSRESMVESWLFERGYRLAVWDHEFKKFIVISASAKRAYNSFFVAPNFEIA